MLFNSVNFFIFIIVILIVYHLVGSKAKKGILFFSSSIYLVILDATSLIIMVLSCLVDYWSALGMAKMSRVPKKTVLIASVSLNLLLLLWFKYYAMLGGLAPDFVVEYLKSMPSYVLSIGIPIGLSFFTFKKISYLVDVYRGDIPCERDVIDFLLYVMILFEVVSGPIDRAGKLLPQLKNLPKKMNIESLVHGVHFVIWGLCMKVVIADRLSLYTNTIFNNIEQYDGASFFVATYFYSVQIYADFFGYTMMALGLGKMFGLELTQNFNLPYFSKSISEFWRRWHITLSYWFRDYLYIPLGGNRKGHFRQCYNFLVVFLLCGLWHGANWTFVVWGGLHGLYLIGGRVLNVLKAEKTEKDQAKNRLRDLLKIIFVFNLVSFAWIFFRANSLSDASYIIKSMITNWGKLYVEPNTFLYGITATSVLFVIEVLRFTGVLTLARYSLWPSSLKIAALYFLLFAVILAGVDSDASFIYVQF